jgi:hypothetical protein
MFLDDGEIHTRSPYSTHRGLDRFSRRKSRSDISSDYEQDRLGLVRTKPELVRPDYVDARSMGPVRSTSESDDYDRPPFGQRDFDYDDNYSTRDYDREARKYRVEYVEDFHNAKLRRRKSFKRSKSDIPLR